MTKLKRTIKEARDMILFLVGGQDKTNMESLALQWMNDALTWLMAEHPWIFMRRLATLTITGTSTALPEGVNDVLAFGQVTDQLYFPVEVGPLRYEREKAADEYTETRIFVREGYELGTAGSTRYNIRFWQVPDTGSVIPMWYTTWMDEWTDDDLETVPPMPPHLFDLVTKRATLDGMHNTGASINRIQALENTVLYLLGKYKKKETFAGPKQSSIDLHPAITSHKASSGRER